jgi:hypothetical protein
VRRNVSYSRKISFRIDARTREVPGGAARIPPNFCSRCCAGLPGPGLPMTQRPTSTFGLPLAPEGLLYFSMPLMLGSQKFYRKRPRVAGAPTALPTWSGAWPYHPIMPMTITAATMNKHVIYGTSHFDCAQLSAFRFYFLSSSAGGSGCFAGAGEGFSGLRNGSGTNAVAPQLASAARPYSVIW